MKALPHALLGLSLVAGGVIVGRSLSSSSPTPVTSSEGSFPTRVSRLPSSGEGETKALKEKHDLTGMRARFRAWSENGGDLMQELERLSVAALKDLILGQMAQTEAESQKERQARQGVISAALRELYRREGVAAYQWLDALEDKNARKNGMMTLLMATVRDHPDAALPWIRKFQNEHDDRYRSYANTFNNLAFVGAAERGADELIRIYDLFGGRPRGEPLTGAKFPVGFNFEKLQSSLAGKLDMAHVFSQWASRDKDAAWQGVKGDIGSRGQPAGRYFGSLVLGAVASEGEAAGTRWAAERLAELPHEQRKFCLVQLDHQGKLTTDGVAAFNNVLPLEDRKGFALGLLNGSRSEEKVFASLDTLPREDLIQVLHEGANRFPDNAQMSASPYGSGVRLLYEEAVSRYSLTPEELGRIRPKAATPAAK